MDISRYVVDAVVLEGRSAREVARAHGLSASWVCKLVRRYRAGGYEALAPRSRRPHSVPSRTPGELEDEIILLRKQLSEDGLDGGAQTIHYHLALRKGSPPSVSTIWRVLKRRGFVTPEPHKRPRSSWIRFEADLPNECWQSDMTHWSLANGVHVEIVNFIDDYSRVAVGSQVFSVTTAPDVVSTFYKCAEKWGFPASVLTDNGCIYTASHRNGRCAMESEMLALGIAYKHSKPYHPQTCGKVERFHQSMKRFLAKQPEACSIKELQAQVDRFVTYYNEVRPHRAKDRKTPLAAFESRDKAVPCLPKIQGLGKEMRVRHDKIDYTGCFTLRYRSRLHHIGMGRAHKGKRVVILVAGLDIRVLAEDGELLRQLTLDPTKDYQRAGGE
ncbi:MAG: IS481 family transposase [Actinomycetota bacterium]